MSDLPARVRAATTLDIAAVLELWALARSSHARTSDHPEGVRQLVIGAPGSLMVAELDRVVVGALVAVWDGWRGNMYRLAVHPAYRRRRIATALVGEGEARLRRLGARRVTALVAHDDQAAAVFWTRVGYPSDPEIARHVRNL